MFVCCGQMPISQNRMISKKKLIALLHLRKPIVKSFEADQNETVLVFPNDEHLSINQKIDFIKKGFFQSAFYSESQTKINNLAVPFH